MEDYLKKIEMEAREINREAERPIPNLTKIRALSQGIMNRCASIEATKKEAV